MEKTPQTDRRFVSLPSQPTLRTSTSSTYPSDESPADPSDLPPSYTLTPDSAVPPTPSTILRLPLRSTPGIPLLPYSNYHIPHGTLSRDKTTITVTDPSLTADPALLAKFITSQAALPPKPEIRIRGIRDSTYERNKLDFDIRINMLRHILRPGSSQSWNHLKIDSGGAPDGLNGGNGRLETWARQFVNDPAAKKSFTLTRALANWNTALLEGRLRTLIASLRYQGRVQIEFCATHRKVVVLCAMNEKSTLYSRVLSLVKEPKGYEVVRSVWPYANMPEEEDNAMPGRECAVQSEREWWEDWRLWIARAVVGRHNGWLTLDDMMEGAMGPEGMGEVRVETDWGRDT